MSKKTAVTCLTLLLILFSFRALAQWLQLEGDIEYLPAFEAWHSATIPYHWLLLSQILILAASTYVIFRIQTERYAFYTVRARWLLWIGSFYFVFMLARFLLSLTLLQTHPWFGATLPAAFHMVLAGFLIVLGFYEYSNYQRQIEEHDHRS
ncbi:MAG: hypothetical protein OEZ23_01085 [Gammaproteobacteria bacterium]|nr:hypothetical protein [Gammaproteobacteria bacterium]